MNQLFQAAAITIIGGADGPTSIYVGKEAVLQILVPCVLYLALLALAVFFLVRSVRRRKKAASVISAVLCIVLLLLPALIIFFHVTEIQKSAEKTAAASFEDFVHKKTDEDFIVFQGADTVPFESLDEDYRNVIEKGGANFLLEKVKSLAETKYCIPNLVCPMTEGDVALCMLLDMYPMSDDYFEENMYEGIPRNTNSARDFWDYVHSSPENRDEIICKIYEYILLFTKSSFIKRTPWTEDEIIGHSFELISEWRVENFYFSKESDGTKTAACVYGKKGKALTAPTEYWYIDEQGFLCISPVPTKTLLTQKVTKIGKMFIDEENGILNAHRNSGEATYRYKKGK